MIWLIFGVALWSAIHFLPTLAIPMKRKLIDAMGDKGYRLMFSVVVLASIVLMVLGWRTTPAVAVYNPAVWTGPAATVLMVVAFILFGAAKHPTRIKRVVRHPQLSGVLLWSVAHLVANGDSRSLVLFGGLGLWALLEIPLISNREGVWVKPPAPPLSAEVKGLAITAVIIVVVILLHPYFAGVPVIPEGA